MATLHEQIADKFLAKLAGSKEIDAGQIEQLKALLADSKKIKAEEFVKIFAHSEGGDIK
jgi:hypothetical protein